MRRVVLFLVVFMLVGPAMAATCVVSQFGTITRASNGADVQVTGAPTADDEPVDYDAATQSDVFNSNTRYIGIVCDAKAHFTIAEDPTADEDNFWVAPDQPLFLGVWAPGLRISFYDGTT